ncbi:hypothetical protein L1D14_07250 [Vibrio tubiashii]|uniref:hypothetical protein n=1 Tax=Vibrio tubiashii TaxID=29498 RepID=UPI001EFC4ADC|nr:hypothetical protein [Vibrio tubiashii]MCG9576033.1 hypothetical protein [Vibrio tubiashii]
MSPNYKQALASFRKYKLKFTELPNDQVTVERRGAVVDFWPNTGTWRSRTGGKSKGLSNLLSFLFNPEQFKFDTNGSNQHSQPKADKVNEYKKLLDQKEIPYTTMTPYLLRISYHGGFVDFWPSSEKWSVNGAKSTVGVTSLLQFLENKILGS